MAKDVAKAKETGVSSMMASMRADAQEHRQAFDRNMLIIPRINILQDLSPQVKQSKVEYIPEAKVGHIYNNILGSLDTEILFVPSLFIVKYLAWKPKRGGLVSQDLTLAEVEENFESAGPGQWHGMMVPKPGEPAIAVEVVETPEWVGIAKGKDWGPMPVAISFPSTKGKAARKINTAIDLTIETDDETGEEFIPAAFYHQFTLSTGIENRDADEWFGWVVNHHGKEYAEPSLIEKAKGLKIAFDKGTAEVDASSAHR